MLLLQLCQGLVQGEQVDLIRGGVGQVGQLDALTAAALLLAAAAANAVHKDAAHRLGRGGKKMSAAVPALVTAGGRRAARRAHKPKVGLMNQSRRLQSLPR